VEAGESIEADRAVEGVNRFGVRFVGVETVAGGEGVACVEADGEAVAGLAVGDHVADVFEAVAETGTLAGGDFEGGADAGWAEAIENLIERVGDLAAADRVALAEVSAGMHDEGGDAELLAALQLGEVGVDAFPAIGRVGRGEIDQVGGVGDDGADAGALFGGAPGLDLGVDERFGVPLALVFDEDLQAVAAGSLGDIEGEMEAACDGHMSPEARSACRCCGHATLR